RRPQRGARARGARRRRCARRRLSPARRRRDDPPPRHLALDGTQHDRRPATRVDPPLPRRRPAPRAAPAPPPAMSAADAINRATWSRTDVLDEFRDLTGWTDVGERELMAELAPSIRGRAILDVGCGGGRAAWFL